MDKNAYGIHKACCQKYAVERSATVCPYGADTELFAELFKSETHIHLPVTGNDLMYPARCKVVPVLMGSRR